MQGFDRETWRKSMDRERRGERERFYFTIHKGGGRLTPKTH